MEITINGKQISRKTVGITVAVICAIILLTGIIANRVGYNTNVDDRVMNILVNSKKKMDEEYHEKENAVAEITKELEAQQAVFDEFNNYKANKATLEQSVQELSGKVTELDNSITAKQTEIAGLDSSISEKNTELERLKNVIVKTGESPITIPAGDFTVGIDIPAGRYSATGSSNLFVYNSLGRNKVNTILGGRIGVDQYVCTLEVGDTVSARARTTFTPIK